MHYEDLPENTPIPWDRKFCGKPPPKPAPKPTLPPLVIDEDGNISFTNDPIHLQVRL